MFTDLKEIQSALGALKNVNLICFADLRGNVTHVNEHFLKISQYSEDEVIGQNYSVLMSGLLDPAYFHHMRETVQSGGIWENEICNRAKDGSLFWLNLTIIPLLDENGEVGKFIAIGSDITKRKSVESSLVQTMKDLSDIKNALDESSIIAITDSKGVITSVNDKFCEISKYSKEELIGKTHRLINSGYHPKSFFRTMWETIRRGEVWKGEVKNRAKDGSEYWMNTTIVPYLDENRKPYQYVSIRTDITARIRAETALAEALQSDFRRTVKSLQNCIFKIAADEYNKFTYSLSEGRLAEELEMTTEQAANKSPGELMPEKPARVLEAKLQLAMEGQIVTFELELMDKWLYVTLSPIKEEDRIVEIVGSMIDITARKEAEQTIHYMAHYDSLTQLPNRTLFSSKLAEALIAAGEAGENVAVLFIDLDRFKVVNDTLGHSVGDKLLKVVAERLKSCLRDSDFVSRQGGDEFTLFLQGTTRDEAEAAASEIIKRMEEPLTVEQMNLYITPSIGISMFPEDGDSIDILLKNADSAMYLAKERGKNNYQFFSTSLHQLTVNKLMLDSELRKALDNSQFELYYQPKINLQTGKMIGLEALIRWNHPELGQISPAQFIPIAEETGLIVPIGEWVMRTACREVKAWQEAGFEQLTIAVNISLRQFMQNDLIDMIKHILESTRLQPQYLELEITESIAHDASHTIRVLNQIKGLGVNISIDDFGTGYSSLSYLSQFPIDRLKIDQSFVRQLNPNNKAIIKTIIDMANNMNVAVIAEGVETEEHASFLKGQLCAEAQGYYFSKPLSSADADLFIRKQTGSFI